MQHSERDDRGLVFPVRRPLVRSDGVLSQLFQGKSGIGIDESRKEIGFHSSLTGIVPRPDLKQYLDRRMRNCLADETEYAYMAAREAFGLAGIEDGYLFNNEVGIIFW